jgi:hypothetical protein
MVPIAVDAGGAVVIVTMGRVVVAPSRPYAE